MPQRRVYGESAATDGSGIDATSGSNARKSEQSAPEQKVSTNSRTDKATKGTGKESVKKSTGKSKTEKDQNNKRGKNSKKGSKKSKAKSYTVKSGDSLEKIARRNGTTVRALQKANGIKGSNIRVGQKITIPAKR